MHIALCTQSAEQLADHHALDSYNQNIFRDWSWGGNENNAVLDCLEGCLEKLEEVENILVLGSGAGRLGIDIHQRLGTATVHLLDSNPLLSFIAYAMAEGTALELTEFPRAPVSELAIRHTLQTDACEGVHVICADALNPPILAASVDLLITPWLIDVIDAPLQQQLQTYAPLIKPGGYWLKHGSLAFDRQDVTQRLDETDVKNLTESNGFEVLHASHDLTPTYKTQMNATNDRS